MLSQIVRHTQVEALEFPEKLACLFAFNDFVGSTNLWDALRSECSRSALQNA